MNIVFDIYKLLLILEGFIALAGYHHDTHDMKLETPHFMIEISILC